MMLTKKMFVIILWLLISINLETITSTKLLELPKSDIIHTASGLILHYVSEYRPAHKVVTFTASLPMVPDMCFLIPFAAMKKIPECKKLFDKNKTTNIDQNNFPTLNQSNQDRSLTLSQSDQNRYLAYNQPNQNRFLYNPPNQNRSLTFNQSNQNRSLTFNQSKSLAKYPPRGKSRPKRWWVQFITLVVGAASFIFGTANTIQSVSLKSEVNSLTKSLHVSEQIAKVDRAQILHLSEGQLKLAQELNHTEQALNQTIQLVNEHSELLIRTEDKLRTITSITHFLNERLAALSQAVETHFIHTSIEDIMQHKLNLNFIHPKDLPQVIQHILTATNITFDESDETVPIITLITKLLVQQRIDFMPTKTRNKSENGVIIGQLMFTSFFAATDQSQPSFSIYELVSIPFTHGPSRVRLAQMPNYIGVNLKASQLLRWSTLEATSCNFELMTSCRETPAIRKDLEDTCIYQVLTDSPLTACRIEGYSDSVFIRRVGQHWAVSTNTTSKCHSIKTLDMEQYRVTENEEIILPPVALVTTMDEESLVCDRFTLPGSPIQMDKTVSFIQNATINPIESDLVDLYTMINNHTQWKKLPHIPSNIQAIIDFMASTPKTEVIFGYQEWIEHPISFTGIIIAVFAILFVGIFVYYFRLKKKKSQNLTIRLPTNVLEMATIQAALAANNK